MTYSDECHVYVKLLLTDYRVVTDFGASMEDPGMRDEFYRVLFRQHFPAMSALRRAPESEISKIILNWPNKQPGFDILPSEPGL